MTPTSWPAAAGRAPRIEFVRLPAVPVAAVLGLLNEPRNRRHMPLSAEFTAEAAERWIAAKDGQWLRHGFGPWAVLVDGGFAGWGVPFRCYRLTRSAWAVVATPSSP